jgi:hypothetical protein
MDPMLRVVDPPRRTHATFSRRVWLGVALAAWTVTLTCRGADEVVPAAWEKQKPLWLVYGSSKTFSAVDGRSCPEALQVKVASKPEQPWGVQAKVPSQVPVEQGDTIMISFEGRVVDGAAGQFRVLFKEHTEPYRSSFEKLLDLVPEWRQFVVVGRSHASFSAGAAQIEFHLGFQPQTVQIAGLKVERTNAAQVDAVTPVPGPGTGSSAGGYYAALGDWLGAAGKGRFIAPDSEEAMMTKLSCAATRVEDIRPAGVPFTRARRLVVKEKTKEFWSAHAAVRNAVSVRAGEVVYCTFWARRGQATEVPTDAPTRIEVHLKRCDPFFLFDDLKTSVGDQWARYALVGKVDKDYAPGQVEAIICIGFQPQVIEVGGVALAAFDPGTNVARLAQSPNTTK